MPVFCRCLLSVVVTMGCAALFLLISASNKIKGQKNNLFTFNLIVVAGH